MKNEIATYELDALIYELQVITRKDVLAHCSADNPRIKQLAIFEEEWSLPQDNSLQAIVVTSIQNKRQEATETLMVAIHTLTWEYKSAAISSPIVLIPVSFHFNKATKTYHFKADVDHFFVNPFLKNELLRHYEIDIENLQTNNYSQFLNDFYDLINKHELSHSVNQQYFLGNFHPDRFHVLKDLTQLQTTELNPLVREILGMGAVETSLQIKLNPDNLFPSDEDQDTVVRLVENGNTVIQGPPGTGKSQVLTNIIGKLLSNSQKHLVVSEKKVALEVLYQKLKSKHLAEFIFFCKDKTSAKEFIIQLKESWLLLEKMTLEKSFQPAISTQLIQQLQLQIDKLNTHDLIGGVDLLTFKNLMRNHRFETCTYQSNVPSLKEWLQQKEKIQQLFQSISDSTILSKLQPIVFSQANNFDVQLKQQIDQLTTWQDELDIVTLLDLKKMIHATSRCVLIENESFQVHHQLFEKKSLLKTFKKLRKAYLQNQLAIQQASEKIKHLSQLPSENQFKEWQFLSHGSWWKRQQLKKQLKTFSINSLHFPQLFEDLNRYFELQQIRYAIEQELMQLGIERPSVELESIHYIFEQLAANDANELKTVLAMTTVKRQQLIRSQIDLKNSLRWIDQHFNLSNDHNIIDQLIPILLASETILAHANTLIQFSPALYNCLQQHTTWETIEAQIIYTHWQQFTALFPTLANLDGINFLQQIDTIIYEENRESQAYQNALLLQRKEKFENYHQLLRTASNQLSSEEKILKNTLKKGKAILVKEFAKTKQFPSIRELCLSEANSWIELLLPIWMMTPSQVAQHLPMENKTFGTVIFDEASQLPLANALGSLQRAERSIVAGDARQMAPSNYFGGATNPVDLLHQSSFYWKNGRLAHHYRSSHPDLIAFSNHYFYQNQLKTFPDALHQQYPIQYHYVQDGRFVDRQNLAEAKTLAQAVSLQLTTTSKIGIVAFSKEQLNCIWKQFSTTDQQIIQARIDDNTLFFKSLEEVQGDECAQLFISIGYAKDENDVFHLRFGPLNQQNGSKRLNVLFSRAQHTMHIFTSIKSEDFGISANESIQLLKQFLYGIENKNTNAPLQFPYQLKPIIEGKNLVFEHSYLQIPSANNLKNLHRVLTNRNWNVQYEI